jgi:hypothetical protein
MPSYIPANRNGLIVTEVVTMPFEVKVSACPSAVAAVPGGAVICDNTTFVVMIVFRYYLPYIYIMINLCS